MYTVATLPSDKLINTGRKPGTGCAHSKIARVRAYYLYCMCLTVLTSVDFDRNEVLSDP